jgi:PAS domain S-box-containing protein
MPGRKQQPQSSTTKKRVTPTSRVKSQGSRPDNNGDNARPRKNRDKRKNNGRSISRKGVRQKEAKPGGLSDEALRESEQRLRMSMGVGIIGAWDWDLIRDEATVSDSYRELFEIPPDVPFSYQSWMAAIHPEDRERCRAYGEAFFASRDSIDWDLEFRIVTPKKGVRWHHAVGRVHRDAKGKPLRFVGSTIDVSEQKLVEEALRGSTQILQSTIDSITDGLLVMDRQWRFTYFSEQAARIIGVRKEDMLGRRVWELFPRAEGTKFYEYYHRALETGQTQHFEEFYPEPLNQWLECSCYPSEEGLTVYFHDVTERKRSQEAAAELQRKLDAALLAGEVATFEWLVVEDRLWGDQNFSRIFRLTMDASGAAPLAKYLEAIHPDDRQRVIELVNRTVETGCTYEAEYRIVSGEQVRWVIARGVAERDENNRVVRFPGVIVDVTERKRAEEALRESELFYRQTLESIPGMVFTTRPDGYCDFQSQQWVDYTGVPVVEHLGDGWNNLLHPDDRLRALEAWRAAYNGRAPYDLEYRVRRRDGEYEWFKVIGRPIRDASGQIVRWFGVAANIDRIKRAEEEQRQAVARHEQQVRLFEGVASSTPDFVYLFDLQGRFRYANRRLLEVWGMKLPEIIGKTCLQLGYEQWHHDMHMREIAQVIETKRPIKGEVPFKAPLTGVFGIYEYIFTPVLDPDGRVELIAGTTRDVTERKEFQAELERQVKERTASLHDMVAELEHFSYSITHDMRAPLRAMRGFAEVIKELLSDSAQPEVRTFIRQIITSAERMDLLITDALNYSRTVRQDLSLGSVDISRLLEGMLDTYPQFLAHRSQIRLDGKLPVVIGNQAGLTQCFSNLIGNALKFIDPVKEPRVRVWAEPAVTGAPHPDGSAQWVRIWVEDNGIGISERMLPRIFDMFTRGTASYGGTGIGLALVRKVVHRMGGKVGVLSTEGQGSRFWVELRCGGECGPASIDVHEDHV